MKDKVFLVTGGAGAIGSTLTNYLTKKDYSTIVIDNLSSGDLSNINESKNLIFYKGNISDERILEKIFLNHKIDYVFHLAAHFAYQNSIDHPEDDLNTNGLGTLNLLEFSFKNNIKSFLYTSTSCIQGNLDKKAPDNYIGNLDTPYAINKLLGEFYVKFYADHFNFNCNTVRLFNVYGPGEVPGKYRNVIPNFFQKAINNEPLIITGTGQETRSYTYVDEVVDAFMKLIIKENFKGHIINIGSDKETKILDLANLINKITGNNKPHVFFPKRSWDNITNRKANIDLAKKLIGFNPKKDLEEGLSTTYQWILNKL